MTQQTISLPKTASKSSTAIRKKPNEKTIAARNELISLSKEAQDILKALSDGFEIEAFEHCESVNDVVLAMHQARSGAKVFKTFHDWKKEGYKVKKGATAFRVWGSPLKAKKKADDQSATDEQGSEDNTEKKYKFWPMCSLFHENQVEKVEGPSPSDSTSESATTEPAAQPETENHRTIDNGNNETVSVGMFPQSDGEFLVMTLTESTTLRTKTGAMNWLKKRGYDEHGQVIQDSTEASQPEENTPESAFVTTDYAERVEARQVAMTDKAQALRTQSNTAYSRAKELASVIPFGQPILVGHHSEKRDRNYRSKIENTFRKSFEQSEKADHYDQKAQRVGKGGIASNDPEAIEKLKAELASAVNAQEVMKAVNKISRNTLSTAEKIAEIVNAGLLTETRAQAVIQPDVCNRIGFAAYQLSNNNANIRRLTQRIQELETLRASDPIDYGCEDFAMTIEDGRILINFPGGKPTEAVRELLKRAAFKWSRYQTAWVRKATTNAVYAAQSLLEQLKAVQEFH